MWPFQSMERETGGGTPPLVRSLAVLVIIVPLLARRRFPFGAPAAIAIAVIDATFGRPLVPYDGFVSWWGRPLSSSSALLRDRTQAVAGFAIVFGAEIGGSRPSDGASGTSFSMFSSPSSGRRVRVGRKSVEADEAKERAIRAEREREEEASQPLPRNGRESRASFMTWSVTASAS